VPQDGPLQLLQGRARLDAQIVDERAARLAVGLQRLRLPTGPVQRRHQGAAQALPERMLCDERLELPDDVPVTAQGEVGIDPHLDGHEPDLLQPRDARPGEALVRDVGQRRAPPQAERVAQPLRRLARQAPVSQVAGLVDQALEAVQIQLAGLHGDQVARRPGAQHVGHERLAQARDVHPQRGRGLLG
jgi:hypothetical protein